MHFLAGLLLGVVIGLLIGRMIVVEEFTRH
jgi:hypothetical protein